MAFQQAYALPTTDLMSSLLTLPAVFNKILPTVQGGGRSQICHI